MAMSENPSTQPEQDDSKNANALAEIKKHCPVIIDALTSGKDGFLAETAGTTLSQVVLKEPGGNLDYVVRALASMESYPIDLLEKAEAKYIEQRNIILRARGDIDLESLTVEKIKYYANNIYMAINSETEHKKIVRAAERELSNVMLGKSSADYQYVKQYIKDNIEEREKEIVEKLRSAEINFLEVKSLLDSVLSENEVKEERSGLMIIKSIQLGIAHLNIWFVLGLIAALGLSATYLPSQALPLVSASIGAVIAHLLAERNAVLGKKVESKEKKKSDEEKT